MKRIRRLAVRWNWWVDRVSKYLERRRRYRLQVAVAAIRWDRVAEEVDRIFAARRPDVALDSGFCPVCRHLLEEFTVREDAPIRHGGYGATRTSVHESCPSCGYARLVSVSEERPWRT